MPGNSEFKDGVPLPNDHRTTVIAGVDGSGNVQAILVDSSGNLGVSAGSSATAAAPTINSGGFASVSTASWASLVTNALPRVIIDITNDLNSGVFISLDAGVTNHMYVQAGSSKLYDLGANGRTHSGSVHVKAVTANPTSGDVYCTLI